MSLIRTGSQCRLAQTIRLDHLSLSAFNFVTHVTVLFGIVVEARF